MRLQTSFLRCGAALSVLGIMTPTSALQAQQADASHHGDLAQQLQNPVSSITSVPFQNNFDFRGGPKHDGFAYTMNFQPVVPFRLSDSWSVISRTIVPLTYTERVAPSHEAGLGDITQSFFFVPRSGITGLTIGLGPALLLPTATRPATQSRQWGAGPTAVVVQSRGPWTFGMLANHIWGFADSADRQGRPSVSNTLLQPFVGYNFGRGLTATVQVESSYDWTARQWTVPIAAGVSQLVPIGGLPVNLGAQLRYWADGPATAPEWGLRFQATMVFR